MPAPPVMAAVEPLGIRGSRMQQLHSGMFARRAEQPFASPFASPFSNTASRRATSATGTLAGSAARRASAARVGSGANTEAIFSAAMRFPRRQGGQPAGQQQGADRGRHLQTKLAQRLAAKTASAPTASATEGVLDDLHELGVIQKGGVEVDAAVLSGRGRSFRCSWGPGGLLVCPGVLNALHLGGARPSITVHRLRVGPRIPRPLCIPELKRSLAVCQELLSDRLQLPPTVVDTQPQELRVEGPLSAAHGGAAHLWFYTGERLPIAWWARDVAIGGRVAIHLVWRHGGTQHGDASDEEFCVCRDVHYCGDDEEESDQWEDDPSPMSRDESGGVRAEFSWRVDVPPQWAGAAGAGGWLCSVRVAAPRGTAVASSSWFRIVERLQLPQGVADNAQGKMLLRCLHDNARSSEDLAGPGEVAWPFPYSSVWELLNATFGQEAHVVGQQASALGRAAWLPREDAQPLNNMSGRDASMIARREQLRTWFRHECAHQLSEPQGDSSPDEKLRHIFELLAAGRVEEAALYAAQNQNARLATILAQPVHGRMRALIEEQLDLWKDNGHRLNGAPSRRLRYAFVARCLAFTHPSRSVPVRWRRYCRAQVSWSTSMRSFVAASTTSTARASVGARSASVSACSRCSCPSDCVLTLETAPLCPLHLLTRRATRLEAAGWARALVRDAAYQRPRRRLGQVQRC